MIIVAQPDMYESEGMYEGVKLMCVYIYVRVRVCLDGMHHEGTERRHM